MGYFNRGSNQGGQRGGGSNYGGNRGGSNYGGSSRGGSSRGGSNYGSDERIEYKTRCHDCGNDCTVPFRPNGSKPVLCRDCFGGGDRRPSGGGGDRGGRGGYSNDRNDRSFGGKPSFNKPAFGGGRSAAGPDLKKDLKQINDKLDAIMSLLSEFAVELDEEEMLDEEVLGQEILADEDFEEEIVEDEKSEEEDEAISFDDEDGEDIE